MAPKVNLYIVLFFLFLNEVFQHVAAQRIDSCHRPARSSSRVSEKKCEEYTRGFKCKNSYKDLDPKLVEVATLGEFPHMAFIGSNTSNPTDLQFFCSGSLISPRFVLTAAHCTTNEYWQTRFVSLGDHNINPTVDDGAHSVQVLIKAVHRHADYNRQKKYNDIALLELEHEVSFSEEIRPACLWTGGVIDKSTVAIISSMDYTHDETLRSDEMQKISVTIEDNEECKKLLNHSIEATQMCGKEATSADKSCKAVGGSPLQIVSEEVNSCIFNIVGVTSFGALRCENKPTVFTKVSSYLDWIESVVWSDK